MKIKAPFHTYWFNQIWFFEAYQWNKYETIGRWLNEKLGWRYWI